MFAPEGAQTRQDRYQDRSLYHHGGRAHFLYVQGYKPVVEQMLQHINAFMWIVACHKIAPYDDPEIVISIVVEGGASGGNLAQAAGEIVNYYFSAEHTVESVDAENTLLR